MTHDELVNLIRVGVPVPGGIWADFGAGSGSFTRALRELVGETATIYAIDRDSAALRQQPPTVQTIQADFTQPLTLPLLDGLLIANALHWVRQQSRTLRLLADTLKPGGRFLIVEYDVTLPRGYIPLPVPYTRFEKLAESTGLHTIQRIGERRSPSSGVVMYAASALS